MILFVAIKAETKEAASELLTHETSVLELVANTREENIKNFVRIKNADDQGEIWTAFRVYVSITDSGFEKLEQIKV